jgi:hypothetical protein
MMNDEFLSFICPSNCWKKRRAAWMSKKVMDVPPTGQQLGKR